MLIDVPPFAPTSSPDPFLTSAPAPSSMPRLVADIGGSNARFGWLAAGSKQITLLSTLPVGQHDTLPAALGHYLEGARRSLGSSFVAPARAALAVATPVTGDAVHFTNSPWSFSRSELQRTLGLRSLVVLNDCEALALALPHLAADQLRPHRAMPPTGGAKAVIGVGTGLGVAAVVPNGRGWLAIPGEGGHATAAAGDDFEAAVLAVARRSFDHVSAERLLSGIGLPLLHGAVCEVLGQPAPSALETPAIVERGLAGDTACERTLATFCALLGSFAGSVALTFGARGGTYIGGGIVPRLGDYFFRSAFRERFEAKGRLRSYMQTIPTAVIVDSLAALTGAAAALDA